MLVYKPRWERKRAASPFLSYTGEFAASSKAENTASDLEWSHSAIVGGM
jgi:hypothetical protein